MCSRAAGSAAVSTPACSGEVEEGGERNHLSSASQRQRKQDYEGARHQRTAQAGLRGSATSTDRETKVRFLRLRLQLSLTCSATMRQGVQSTSGLLQMDPVPIAGYKPPQTDLWHCNRNLRLVRLQSIACEERRLLTTQPTTQVPSTRAMSTGTFMC